MGKLTKYFLATLFAGYVLLNSGCAFYHDAVKVPERVIETPGNVAREGINNLGSNLGDLLAGIECEGRR
ncbi:hypothetical protein COU61_05080 [Candidatus Pacearchaeota archaeon CG10_big_fil_rev_8_21_14_0_10_35_13]|nr:MAG: hypothetical protein COU61_05080 [Candidatus Pacearchaeota archaeon CG10_big_fil_rev_8_21_14_0_10_35_13]